MASSTWTLCTSLWLPSPSVTGSIPTPPCMIIPRPLTTPTSIGSLNPSRVSVNAVRFPIFAPLAGRQVDPGIGHGDRVGTDRATHLDRIARVPRIAGVIHLRVDVRRADDEDVAVAPLATIQLHLRRRRRLVDEERVREVAPLRS